MTEQSAHPKRTAHEHLTFTEAGERLGITANAVRMRVHRGSLASIRVNERTFVLWPQPEQPHARHDGRTRDERADERAGMQGDARLIERLEAENAYLRSTLDAEIEARRREDHLVAALMERLPELPAGDHPQNMPQERDPATLQGDPAARADTSLSRS